MIKIKLNSTLFTFIYDRYVPKFNFKLKKIVSSSKLYNKAVNIMHKYIIACYENITNTTFTARTKISANDEPLIVQAYRTRLSKYYFLLV